MSFRTPAIGRPRARLGLSPVALAWVALVCALGHLGGALHFALVEHVVCIEHGALVHVDAEHDHGGEASGAPGHLDGWAARPAHDADAHEHDHCPLATEDRVGGIRVVSAQGNALDLPAVALLSGLDEAGFPPTGTLYGLAPKTSPPA
jgi:hypothetical protein